MVDRNESVRVIVRIRPLSEKEKQDGRKMVVIAERERAEITIHNPKGEKEQPKRFTFDSAYGVDATQREIYDRTASPIVGTYRMRFSFLVDFFRYVIFGRKKVVHPFPPLFSVFTSFLNLVPIPILSV